MSLRLSGGRRLQSPPGDKARPTSSRVRLAVMNLLAAELPGSRWLDLCSGSGVMACEALQRGAAAVVAIEHDRRIAATARTNLAAVVRGLPGPAQTQVHCSDVLRWLSGPCPQGSSFNLIYVDPPYASGLYGPVAAAVLQGGWLSPGGTLIWECSAKTIPTIPEGWLGIKERRYGSTCVLLLQVNSAAQHAAAAVLVPGCHEQTQQGHGNQTEHDAAEQGFDHGEGGASGKPQFFHDPGPPVSISPQL
jgi:16S rRNA (guanine966-N2)-methyltransferase